MIFVSEDLKKALTIVKRIYKDKKIAKLYISSQGDMRYQLCGKNEDGSMYIYTEMLTEDVESFNIECNPYELEFFAKMKKEVIELEHTKDHYLVRKGDKNKVAYLESKKDIHYYNKDLKEVDKPELLLKIFQSASVALKSANDYFTSFVKMNDQRAVIALPKEIHSIMVRHELPFELGYLHRSMVDFIVKSVKKDFKMGMDGNYLVIKTDDFYFLADVKKPVDFPNLKNILRPTSHRYSFEVDPNELQDAIKDLKKEVNRLVFTMENGKMKIDPRHEGYEPRYVSINLVKGEFEKTIFDTQCVKSLIDYYVKEEEKPKKGKKKKEEEFDLFSMTGTQASGEAEWLNDIKIDNKDTVKIEKYTIKNRKEKDGFIWRLDTLEKQTYIAGIEEPDFDKLEKYYLEGRLDELMSK